MLHVGVEDDPGHSSLCMVCGGDVDAIYPTFYVVAWEHDLPHPPPNAVVRKQGGLLRVCEQHADELLILLSEALP